MIFTDFIRKNATNGSTLTKEDFEFFDKKVFNDGGRELKSYMDDPSIITLFFDKGFIVYDIQHRDGYGYNEDIVCTIYALYKHKKPGFTILDIGWARIVAEFWKYLKINKCTKVVMYTKLTPDFWKKYGFKVKRYEMERNL